MQANVDRLKLEYIEEKRVLREEEQRSLADARQAEETRRVEAPKEEVVEQVKEEEVEDGLSVGDREKREIEMKRRQFGEWRTNGGGRSRAAHSRATLFGLGLTVCFTLSITAVEQSKLSSQSGNPSDGFQPEAWTPSSAPRRR